MHIGMSSVVRANASGRGDLRCIGSLANGHPLDHIHCAQRENGGRPQRRHGWH
jgi:hypothetical protein